MQRWGAVYDMTYFELLQFNGYTKEMLHGGPKSSVSVRWTIYVLPYFSSHALCLSRAAVSNPLRRCISYDLVPKFREG